MNAAEIAGLITAITALIGAVTGLIIAVNRMHNGIVAAINTASNSPQIPGVKGSTAPR